jgi:hypothetical protein
MTGNQRRKSSYGESWLAAWAMIVIASAVVVSLGLNGGAAVFIAFVLVLVMAGVFRKGRR